MLDALAGALIAVLLLLALAALFTMFPPGGLALAGGGMLGGGITISGTLLLETALVGAISGVLLAEAAGAVVARFDDLLRSFTEHDSRGLVRRLAAGDVSPQWWWDRLPVSGPVRTDLVADLADG